MPSRTALFAAQEVGIGTLDVAAILVFHPAMASYDPFNKAFLKADGMANSQNPVKKEKFARQSAEATEKINELRSQIKAIDGKIDECKKRNSRDTHSEEESFALKKSKLSDSENKGKLTTAKSYHDQAMSRLSQTFMGEIRALQAQKEQIETLIEQVNSMGRGPFFCDFSETDQRIRGILAEVRQITQTVAASRGIKVVLDSSSSGLRQTTSQEPAAGIPDGNSYRMIFVQQVLPQQLSKDAPAVKGNTLIQQDLAKTWYLNRDFVLSPFRKYLIGSFVFVGGVDLTKDVLAAVLGKYKLDKSIQSVLLQAVSTEK